MKIHVKKTRWYLAIANAILLLLVLVCLIVFSCISDNLDTIHAAKRWRGSSDMRFAQIGCFLPVDDTRTEEDILTFRQTLEQKLVDASLDSADGTTLYADAYSGVGKLTVTGDHGKTEARVTGVGGNFFLFHPLQLLSGSYISGDDLMQDRVILDESLAWQLFGSSNVAGMTVYVGDTPLYVAGVIRRETDRASREAYGKEPGMFLSYSAFEALTEEGITCYEIVLPDMISGFGLSLVQENFKIGNGDIVETSNRYALSKLFSVIGSFGRRSMRNNGVIYPYWENAVRMTEDQLALLLVLILIFAALPAGCALVFAIRTLIRLYRTAAKELPARLDAAKEWRREVQYAQKGKR